MIYYYKLVRDGIPQKITAQGETPYVEVLGDADYHGALLKKIYEEIDEYKESGQAEELADILEVVFALAQAQGCSPAELLDLCDQKRKARGGFAKRYFLTGKEK